MPAPTDNQLAQLVRGGRRQAFGELVRRYQAPVFNVCYRLVGERREAEDLAQETFIRAYQRFDYYDVKRPFGPWIRRVAANVCLNQLQVRRLASLPLEDERDEDLLPAASDPETLRVQAENQEALRLALLSLPPDYRVTIELRHYQDLSYAEIASALSIPLSDVKSRLFRARQMLARRLKADAE